MMKKVLFIIFSFSKGGGAESLLTTIVNNLDAKKYDISIIEIVGDTKKVEPVNSNIKVLPYLVKTDDPNRKEIMYSFWHEWDMVIKKYIPQGFDLYVSFNINRPTFLLPPNGNNLAWIHGAMQKNKEELELQREAFKKVKKIISISNTTTDILQKDYPEHANKIVEIYNGLDIERVRKKAEEKTDINIINPAIIMVGRLDENKNPLRLLDIFELLHKVRRDVHLYYLGYGNLDNDINELARDKGLNEYVHLLGYAENPFPIMKQCDVCCVTSLDEGFSLVLAESIALGVPFVSTNVGIAKVISNEGKCGKVIDTNEQAVDAIVELLESDRTIVCNECRESIERFELRKYIKKIENVLDEMLMD